MAGKNGYFQLHSKDSGTYLKLIPQVGDGEPINFKEVVEYLTKRQIEGVKINELNDVIRSLRAEREVLISPIPVSPQREWLEIKMPEDKMQAIGRFYPPFVGAQKIDLNEVVSILASYGIKNGIKKENIEEFLKDREYCRDYILAEGNPPVQGSDAEIVYHFSTDLTVKPQMNEDGSVDYHNLNNIAKTTKGSVLATLVKEVPGKAGMNVMGEPIKPREVKKGKLKFGRNIQLSEDKTKIISEVDGHVTLVEDKVFVSNIYEVENVDNSTGDIIYEGTVLVKGNVGSNFSIIAKGNIEVNGVVESAVLKADGDITLKRGIQGMGKGRLEAKGNIIAKFIENATVTCGGFIQTGAIMHSKVSAKGEIEISGKKGFVTGGIVRSTTMISAKTIGSPMGTETVLEVGVDPVMKERHQELQQKIREAEKILASGRPVLNAFGKKLGNGEKFTKDQMQNLQQLSKKCKEAETLIVDSCREMQEIEEAFSNETQACIKASETVYTGVKIVISDVSFFVRENMTFCRFVKKQGEVSHGTM